MGAKFYNDFIIIYISLKMKIKKYILYFIFYIFYCFTYYIRIEISG